MLSGILETTEMASYSTTEIIYCSLVALGLGCVISLIFHFLGESSKNYKVSLAVLPLLVCSIIMMVNGNLGTSVAVLGSFSLIRFRSQPGNSKEISGVFFAMTVGVAAAMGCFAFAALLTLVVGIILIITGSSRFSSSEKMLKIVIPENLDYTDIFDEIFDEFTKKSELINVKTTNMGSMFELKYRIILKADTNEKNMIDKIRCKNGNLTVMCSQEITTNDAL